MLEKPIDQMKDDIINLLKDCVRSWENIPRPDNQFQRTDVNVLSVLDLNDEIVQSSLEEINNILDNNFSELSRVDVIFKDFIYLF